MHCRVALTCLLLIPGVLGCLWDRDTVAAEGMGRADTVKVIVGWFDRFPPEFYEHRLQRVASELESNPERLSLYDDAAVACDRLERPDEAISWMEKKAAKLHLESADTPQPNHRYRYLANLGTFHAHRWIKQPAEARTTNLEDLKTAESLIAQAIEENPDAHFGREKYQLEVIRWFLAGEQLAEEMLRERFGVRTMAIHTESAMPRLEEVGRDDAAEGFAGMIRLGAGWRSVDLFKLLAGSLQAEGRSSLALLAQLRAGELAEAGGSTLHPIPAMEEMLGSFFGHPVRDRASVEAYFRKVRSAADRRHADRIAYVTARLDKGEHPDTHAGFWDGWKEPRFPRLPNNWWGVSAFAEWSPASKAALIAIPALIVLFIIIQSWQRRRHTRQSLASA